ncbi:MAG: hypothetical protein AAFW84_28835 [Cyanobacteria bacterium J06635_15]
MPPSENTIDFRQELDMLLRLKQDSGGFHYTYQAQQLANKARKARKWYNLLKRPMTQWRKIRRDTQVVLEELEAQSP